jgi:hypothetical protein
VRKQAVVSHAHADAPAIHQRAIETRKAFQLKNNAVTAPTWKAAIKKVVTQTIGCENVLSRPKRRVVCIQMPLKIRPKGPSQNLGSGNTSVKDGGGVVTELNSPFTRLHIGSQPTVLPEKWSFGEAQAGKQRKHTMMEFLRGTGPAAEENLHETMPPVVSNS